MEFSGHLEAIIVGVTTLFGGGGAVWYGKGRWAGNNYKALHEENTTLKAKLDQLESKINDLVKEVSDLREGLAQEKTEAKWLRKEVEELKESNNRLEKENIALSVELETLRSIK